MKKKIVLIGDSAVGKTSLIRRFILDAFDDEYITTVGSKVTKKELRIPTPDKTVDLTLMIWDLLGQEGYSGFQAWTLAGANGAILVTDLTRQKTLESLERYWIPTLSQVVENIPMVFVGNKADLKAEHSYGQESIAEVASRFNIGISEALPPGLSTSYITSAKTGENVQRAFESLGHLVLAGEPENPFKDLFERFVAMGVARSQDRTTPIGALDAIIVDFCESSINEFDDKVAMMILRQEILRSGVDVRKPSRDAIMKLVGSLARVEAEFSDPESVEANRERRMRWARGTS